MIGSVNGIESMGTLDGPGIRTVIFLNGCNKRCKYCHNPEMWYSQDKNMSSDEVVQRVLRNRPYYGNNGGVTFSGGEPLLQYDFLLDVCKKLKNEGIHIALDTAGVRLSREEIFEYIDLVLLDVKHVTDEGYRELVSSSMDEFRDFVSVLNRHSKVVWIRQVVVPGIHDNDEYLQKLAEIVREIEGVERIDFLPYHRMGIEKYEKLNIPYPMMDVPEMDKGVCRELEERFMKILTDE